MCKARVIAAVAIPALSLVLAGCGVSQSKYDQVVAENQQLRSQVASLQQEQKWVEAGDMLFPSGGWQLSPEGMSALDALVPRLTNLTNAKIVVYGYTDDAPVGATLKNQGISNNLDLSSKRAGAVVTYLASKGVDPSLMSAKGRGDTHPVAPNDSPEGRAKNRRIEVVLTGPGA
ncbi:MAG: OmpA family protein [Dongiaceae bacterium]